MAANSQPTRATSRKRGCSLSAIQTSRRKSAAVEPSFPIPFQRGIGDGSFPFEGLYTALYVQGVLQNASDPGNNVALYVQGGIPDASGLGRANQVALYAQNFVLITLSLEWSRHFALYVQGVLPNASDLNHDTNVTLYVQGGIADAPGLSRVSQVALYLQGLVLTTPLLDWSQHSTLYAQGGIQDHSVAGRTPSFFQSLLNPTQLSKCSCCPIDQLTPGGPMSNALPSKQ